MNLDSSVSLRKVLGGLVAIVALALAIWYFVTAIPFAIYHKGYTADGFQTNMMVGVSMFAFGTLTHIMLFGLAVLVKGDNLRSWGAKTLPAVFSLSALASTPILALLRFPGGLVLGISLTAWLFGFVWAAKREFISRSPAIPQSPRLDEPWPAEPLTPPQGDDLLDLTREDGPAPAEAPSEVLPGESAPQVLSDSATPVDHPAPLSASVPPG